MREVAIWEAKTIPEVLQTLARGRVGFDVEYLGRRYHLVVDLLASDEEMLTVSLAMQPDDPDWIDLIAEPRLPGSGGYTNEQTGCASRVVFLQRR